MTSPNDTNTSQSLFRVEVAQHRAEAWLPDATIEPPGIAKVFALLAAVAALTLLATLVFGSYARKTTLEGVVVPVAGSAKVYPPFTGTLIELLVSEGTKVAAHQAIAIVSGARPTSTGQTIEESQVMQLRDRLARHVEERMIAEASYKTKREALRQSIIDAGAKLESVTAEMTLVLERIRLAEDVLKNYETLRREGFVAGGFNAISQKRDELLSLKASLERLKRTRTELLSERKKAEQDLTEQAQAMTLTQSRIAEASATTEVELSEAREKYRTTVTAPREGRVTALLFKPGQRVESALPMMTIVASETESFEIVLYAPSKAIPTLREGMSLKLRYDAYPYQTFGMFPGQILEVAKGAVDPQELPASLRATLPKGALYPIRVRIPSQSISSGGRDHAIVAGMTLQADVNVERRHLYEWLVAPLRSLTRTLDMDAS